MMKKIAFFLVVFQMASFMTTAQPANDKFLNSKRPYFIINGKHVDALSFLVLDYEQIEDIKILPPDQARKYGAEAKYGAVEIKLKSNSPLISLPELLKLFHIRADAVNLRDKKLGFDFSPFYLKEPELLVISPGMVRSVNLYEAKDGKSLSIYRISEWKIKPELSMRSSGKKFDAIITSLNAIFEEENKKNSEQQGEIIVGYVGSSILTTPLVRVCNADALILRLHR